MNTKQLKYVLALAKAGSFSKAADILGITQPSLSQYVKKIETEQGVQLFNRTGGEVRLTDAGRVFIESGRKILDIEQQMERKFEDINDFAYGSIVIGVSPHRCIHLMPEIVKRFRSLYPGISLVIEERVGQTLLEDTAHGLFDLCIANLPVDDRVFDYQLIMEEDVLLAVNKDSDLYRRLKRNAQNIDHRRYPAIDYNELSGEPFATLADSQPTQKILDDICVSSGIQVTTAVECRTIETQFAMVRAGIGSALIPSGISEFSNSENIEFFSFIQSYPYRRMAVITRKGQYISKAMKDLIDIMMNLRIG